MLKSRIFFLGSIVRASANANFRIPMASVASAAAPNLCRGALGSGAEAAVRQALSRLPQEDPAAVRAFWAVVGASVADAAATQSHWNYKIEPFHATLKERGTYDVSKI
jgi:hypothetical protein